MTAAMLGANGLEASFIEKFASHERTFALQISHGPFEAAMTVNWTKFVDMHNCGVRLDTRH
jgi:hypothetical protein